jgi:ABC-2 type transport system permease protein
MNKIFAVLKREYLAAVRKKMFMVMTVLFPVLMAGVFFVPMMMMSKSLGGKRVAVVDGTGRLHEAFSKPLVPEVQDPRKAMSGRGGAGAQLPTKLNIDYVDVSGKGDLKAATQPYLDKLRDDAAGNHLYDAVLIVPGDAFTSAEAKLTFYSRAATDIMTQEKLSSVTNGAIHRQRLLARGLGPAQIDELMRELPIEGIQLSRGGEQKRGGDLSFLVGMLMSVLLLVPSFVYGVEVMRGIIQEKSDRVVEVLISSMSSSQLLIGKVAGLAAVGLTQIFAWLIFFAALAGFGGAVATTLGVDVTQFIHPMFFVYFLVFFILGYLTNVCVYAVAGSACNTDKEAQQLIAPIQMVMMLPWFMMMAIITNPEGGMAVGFSLAPVFGPMVMFVRTMVSDPPLWHVAVCIAVSAVTISIFLYVTAKIFRVGILSYGKRPTIPELWRWLKVA